MINLGTIRNYRKSKDNLLTLYELKFFVGDLIDLTIMTQEEK